jgi:ATP-binding cassette subfamily B protein
MVWTGKFSQTYYNKTFDYLKENSKEITIKNLFFKYENSEAFTIKGMKAKIKNNSINVIVGKSGCGKTTLLKILLKLYDCNTDSVKVQNVSLNKINEQEWYNKTGAVLQESKLFNDTILNNISLSEEPEDMELVRVLVNKLGMNDFIENLNYGINTYVSEDGNNLSIGQKQKILIARALYRKPEFLFFDEATNGIDYVAERNIFQHLQTPKKDTTIIMTSHKLNTIKQADNILVMAEGRIMEQGSFEELTSKLSHFSLLFSLQPKQMQNMKKNIVNKVKHETKNN